MNDNSALWSNFDLGQPSYTTPLTPHSEAVATAQGGANQTTDVQFLTARPPVNCWTAMVSNSTIQVSLSKDRGNSLVTLKAGLTVNFLAQAQGQYTVTANGEIVDEGDIYKLDGTVLGIFTSVAKSGSIKRLT